MTQFQGFATQKMKTSEAPQSGFYFLLEARQPSPTKRIHVEMGEVVRLFERKAKGKPPVVEDPYSFGEECLYNRVSWRENSYLVAMA